MQGNAQGQCNLGQALIDGKGIEKNYYLGYVWSGIAIKSSSLSFAKHNQTQVGSALNPEQRVQTDKASPIGSRDKNLQPSISHRPKNNDLLFFACHALHVTDGFAV
jgi:TPR repeat protein